VSRAAPTNGGKRGWRGWSASAMLAGCGRRAAEFRSVRVWILDEAVAQRHRRRRHRDVVAGLEGESQPSPRRIRSVDHASWSTGKSTVEGGAALRGGGARTRGRRMTHIRASAAHATERGQARGRGQGEREERAAGRVIGGLLRGGEGVEAVRTPHRWGVRAG
jgi:hypothetical protein